MAGIHISRDSVLQLVVAFLKECGLEKAAQGVRCEMGQTAAIGAVIEQSILSGSWGSIYASLNERGGQLQLSDSTRRRLLWEVRKQEFLELYHASTATSSAGAAPSATPIVGQLVEALRALEDVAPSTDAFKAVAYTLSLPMVTAHPDYCDWSPYVGRNRCLEAVEALLMSAGVDLSTAPVAEPPPGQLLRLLAQAGGALLVMKAPSAANAANRVVFDPCTSEHRSLDGSRVTEDAMSEISRTVAAINFTSLDRWVSGVKATMTGEPLAAAPVVSGAASPSPVTSGGTSISKPSGALTTDAPSVASSAATNGLSSSARKQGIAFSIPFVDSSSGAPRPATATTASEGAPPVDTVARSYRNSSSIVLGTDSYAFREAVATTSSIRGASVTNAAANPSQPQLQLPQELTTSTGASARPEPVSMTFSPPRLRPRRMPPTPAAEAAATGGGSSPSAVPPVAIVDASRRGRKVLAYLSAAQEAPSPSEQPSTAEGEDAARSSSASSSVWWSIPFNGSPTVSSGAYGGRDPPARKRNSLPRVAATSSSSVDRATSAGQPTGQTPLEPKQAAAAAVSASSAPVSDISAAVMSLSQLAWLDSEGQAQAPDTPPGAAVAERVAISESSQAAASDGQSSQPVQVDAEPIDTSAPIVIPSAVLEAAAKQIAQAAQAALQKALDAKQQAGIERASPAASAAQLEPAVVKFDHSLASESDDANAEGPPSEESSDIPQQSPDSAPAEDEDGAVSPAELPAPSCLSWSARQVGSFHDSQPIRALAWQPGVDSDAPLLAVGTNSKALKLLDCAGGQDEHLAVVGDFAGHHLGSVYSIDWAAASAHGGSVSLLATCSNDTTVKVLRLTSGSAEVVATLQPGLSTLRDVCWLRLSDSQLLLAAAGGGDFSIKVYDCSALCDTEEHSQPQQPLAPAFVLSGHSSIVHALQPFQRPGAAFADGLVSASADGTLRLWSIHDADGRTGAAPCDNIVSDVASQLLRTQPVSSDARVELHSLALVNAPVDAAAPYFAIGTSDGTVALCSSEGRVGSSSRVHEGEVRSLHAAGPLLLSASFDGSVAVSQLPHDLFTASSIVSDADTGTSIQPIARLPHGDKALCCRWHPASGRALEAFAASLHDQRPVPTAPQPLYCASSAADKTVQLWQLHRGSADRDGSQYI